jgi:Transposase DDE domain
LEKNAKKGLVDTLMYIGKQMFQCRLVAYQVPPEIESKRRKEYLKECRKRKRVPNKEYLKRLAYTIFITNVPITMWRPEVLGTIYRLRWQIELIFKCWKSDLKFDCFVGSSLYRIQCLLYAKLTVVLMTFSLHSSIDKMAWEILEKETSIHKVISWLAQKGRWMGIVLEGTTKKFWNDAANCLNRCLCKDKRQKRKTTRELIELEMEFGCVTC